jgi:hypothetical protein
LTWMIPAETVTAAKEPKSTICHVTDPGALPFASGHVITVSQNACKAHCQNHGGDQTIGDNSCAFQFPMDDACIVNSGAPNFCTPARCEATCDP